MWVDDDEWGYILVLDPILNLFGGHVGGVCLFFSFSFRAAPGNLRKPSCCLKFRGLRGRGGTGGGVLLRGVVWRAGRGDWAVL